jgi:hypothetical protein
MRPGDVACPFSGPGDLQSPFWQTMWRVLP